MADTNVMPVINAGHPSPFVKGPRRMARAAPMMSRISLTLSALARAGESRPASPWLASRVAMIAMQNTGRANIFAKTPAVPKTSAAPRVTKLPVTWAVNNPCSARNPAVST